MPGVTFWSWECVKLPKLCEDIPAYLGCFPGLKTAHTYDIGLRRSSLNWLGLIN